MELASLLVVLAVYAAVATVFGLGGAYVAGEKRRPLLEGFVFGLVFGPLGVLVEVLLPEGAYRPGFGRRGDDEDPGPAVERIDLAAIARADRPPEPPPQLGIVDRPRGKDDAVRRALRDLEE